MTDRGEIGESGSKFGYESQSKLRTAEALKLPRFNLFGWSVADQGISVAALQFFLGGVSFAWHGKVKGNVEEDVERLEAFGMLSSARGKFGVVQRTMCAFSTPAPEKLRASFAVPVPNTRGDVDVDLL